MTGTLLREVIPSAQQIWIFSFSLPFIILIGCRFRVLLLVSRFLVFSYTFIFIITECLLTFDNIYLGGKLRSWRSSSRSMVLLGRFCCSSGLDWTNNPINRSLRWWLSRISARVISLRAQVIQCSVLGIYQIQILSVTDSLLFSNKTAHSHISSDRR